MCDILISMLFMIAEVRTSCWRSTMKPYAIAGIALFVFAFNYPTRADEVISLAGDWNFRLDPQHLGHIQKWHDEALPDRIKLPGSTDEAGYGNKTSGPANGSLSRPYIYEGPA